MNPPKMPIHIGDYLRDTRHLSAIEHGAYLLLMFHYWATGGLPNDDRRLAAIAGVSVYQWQKKIRPAICVLFKKNWRHSRIDADLAAAQKSYEKRANAGGKGGKAKAQAKQCSSNATAKPQQPLTLNPTNPTEEEPNGSPSVVALAGKRGSRLADNWQPTDADLKAAGDIGLRLYEIDSEVPKFVDYWTNKPGKAGLMLDWSKTWRNWCRKARELKPNGNGHGQRSNLVETADRLIAAEKARAGDDTGPLLDLTAESSGTSEAAPWPLPKR